MHVHRIENEHGDLVDLVPFCSDHCHFQWCQDEGVEYEGWDGCHEVEYLEFCECCGEAI